MSARQPRYSKEEHARRGATIYEQQVRPLVEAGNDGKIVAIDVDSGAFEVADDTLTAADRLLARCPDAQIWSALGTAAFTASALIARRRQNHERSHCR